MDKDSKKKRGHDERLENDDSSCSNPPVSHEEEPDDPRENKRAQVYGLQLNDLLSESVVVGPGKYVRLSGLNVKQDEPGFGRLRPKDLDDVKRWIGVPDSLGAKRSLCMPLPAEFSGVSSPADLRKLDVSSQRALYDLAHEYVHGDSNRVVQYKATLDHFVDRAEISGVFLRKDIHIRRGAVLEIAKDVKILFARHINIYWGGLLKLKGATKIDCVTINGGLVDYEEILAQTNLPGFASYVNAEVVNG